MGQRYANVLAYLLLFDDGRGGQLTRLNRQSARGTASCYLDVNANGKTIVVANYSTGGVAALRVQADGSLGKASGFVQHTGSSVDPKRQTGPNAHCIVVSPDNRFALAADLGIDKILIDRLNPRVARLTSSEAAICCIASWVRPPPSDNSGSDLTFDTLA